MIDLLDLIEDDARRRVDLEESNSCGHKGDS